MLYIDCDFYLLFLTFQALPDRCARMQNESEQSFMFHFNAGRMFCARTLDFLLQWKITLEVLHRSYKPVIRF